MTRQTLHHPITIYLPIAGLLIASAAFLGSPPGTSAQEKKDKAQPSEGRKDDEQAHHGAEQMVRAIEMQILRGDKWIKTERIEKPVLFYGDPTRNNDRGSVWAWGKKGRPVAVLELYQNLDLRTDWVFAICNSSGGTLRARRADAPWWLENESATQLKDIPRAPAPASEAPLRQRQLKLLADKFTGHQFWDPDNTRYELRLLKRPLCSYRDEESGVLEGGLFALANGTNPEILLFIEARVDPTNRSKRVWQYAVGRLAHAELHLEYDGKEIFEAPRGDRLSGSNQPYWLGFLKADVDAHPKRP